MQKIVSEKRMSQAGTILAEELGEFLNCDEEELQTLLDGKSNPYYWDVYDSLNPYTLDERVLLINEDSIWITETEEEFEKYSRIID